MSAAVVTNTLSPPVATPMPTRLPVPWSSTVLIPNPAIRTDEPEDAARLQRPQSHLVEADIDIGPPHHGRACGTVGRPPIARHILQADVRRVAQHEVGTVVPAIGKKKIS